MYAHPSTAIAVDAAQPMDMDQIDIATEILNDQIKGTERLIAAFPAGHDFPAGHAAIILDALRATWRGYAKIWAEKAYMSSLALANGRARDLDLCDQELRAAIASGDLQQIAIKEQRLALYRRTYDRDVRDKIAAKLCMEIMDESARTGEDHVQIEARRAFDIAAARA